MIKKYLHYAVAAAFAVASGTGNLAFGQVVEQEPNDTFVTDPGKRLVFDASKRVEVQGIIGTNVPLNMGASIPDVDFYSFVGQANDVVTINIDGAWKSNTTEARSLDSVIAIYGPNDFVMRTMDDVAPGAEDEPETPLSRRDPRLDEVLLPYTGVYTVGVTSTGRIFVPTTGDVTAFVAKSSGTNGSYKLIITGVSPANQVIGIDIKPGTDRIARLNPKSKGDIAVALLSSPTFDALKVDRASLTFGATGDEQSLERCAKRGYNVDRRDNRLLDLVCLFDIQKAGFDESHEEGVLRGTIGGVPFEGKGWLKVIHVKRKHHKDRHHHHGRDRNHDRDDD
jgi:Bacterial pre-peptidase C-terminal domain